MGYNLKLENLQTFKQNKIKAKRAALYRMSRVLSNKLSLQNVNSKLCSSLSTDTSCCQVS